MWGWVELMEEWKWWEEMKPPNEKAEKGNYEDVKDRALEGTAI